MALRPAQLYSTQSYQTKDLSGIGLRGNDLTGWDFSEQNLTGAATVLFDADRRESDGGGGEGSQVSGTTFLGFTQQQLSLTESYKNGDLSGIELGSNDLTGWDFRGKDLSVLIFLTRG